MLTRPAGRYLRLNVADVLLVAALIGLPVLALVRGSARARESAAAYVYRDGRLVAVLALDRDREFAVESGRYRLLLEVRDGGVSVKESSCPRGICRHTGHIDRPGRPIVCIPGRVVVEVRGRYPGYDAETY